MVMNDLKSIIQAPAKPKKKMITDDASASS